MTLELPAEALVQHLGLKSWAFTYNAPPGEFTEVRIFHCERDQDGVWVDHFLASYIVESDPSGQQRITFVIGPAGASVPYSLGINTTTYSDELENFDLNSFNASATTQPGTLLPPTGTSNTFILMAHYPKRDGGVTVTGNPDDMEAYLALEVSQVRP